MQTNNGKGPHKTEIFPNGNLLIFTNTFKFLEPPLLQVRVVTVSLLRLMVRYGIRHRIFIVKFRKHQPACLLAS